jgi:UDP-glucose 4-epimerase
MIEGILRTLVLDGAVGESFNIGNQRAVVSVYGLASTIVARTPVLVGDPIRPTCFRRHRSADTQYREARDVLGFEAQVDLEDGIRRTAEYFMAHHV